MPSMPTHIAGYSGRRPPRGLAVGLILLAIVLLAAIAIAIAWGARQKSGSADEAKMLATTILNEGVTLKRGYDGLTAQGAPITSITFDTAADTGLFSPTNGIPAPVPPAQALVTPAAWIQLWDTKEPGRQAAARSQMFHVCLAGGCSAKAAGSGLCSLSCSG